MRNFLEFLQRGLPALHGILKISQSGWEHCFALIFLLLFVSRQKVEERILKNK
jgi:hypothetical protein